MLPAPVTFPGSRHIRRGVLTSPSGTRRRLYDILRAPARLTNLSALLLLVLALTSLLFNFRKWVSTNYITLKSAHDLSLPSSIASTFERPMHLRVLDHLILVPGHGVWMGSRKEDILDEDRWMMDDFQRNRGRPAMFLEHIRRGAEVASQDPGSLLIFSGGQTTFAPVTEAESYTRLAQTASIIPTHSSAVPSLNTPESTTESFALDSFQNLLFALARFREYTGRFPNRITIVGYAFKAHRFEQLHASALRWPAGRLTYIGVDLPDKADEAQAAKGEFENGFRPFTTDVYGCREALTRKRRARNPHLRAHAYHLTAPELAALLEWCPADGTAIFPGPLPWDV